MRRVMFALFVQASVLVPFSEVLAHPVPDVPVRGHFMEGGAMRIDVEIDTRCLEDDPENTPYLTKAIFESMDERAKTGLIKQAGAFLKATTAFHFEPSGQVEPSFSFRFTTHGAKPLEKPDDPVMITGSWETKLPEGTDGYRIEALPAGKLSVVFLNYVRGKQVPRLHVLFPGEASYTLDVSEI
ncbi:hypothetical protein BH23VER1_BH23VER1_34160 [soil metagenome]